MMDSVVFLLLYRSCCYKENRIFSNNIISTSDIHFFHSTLTLPQSSSPLPLHTLSTSIPFILHSLFQPLHLFNISFLSELLASSSLCLCHTSRIPVLHVLLFHTHTSSVYFAVGLRPSVISCIIFYKGLQINTNSITPIGLFDFTNLL